MTTRPLVAEAGELRVCSLHDGFVDIEAFKATPHYEVFYRQPGIADRMYIGIPVNRDAEAFLLVDRNGAGAALRRGRCEAGGMCHARNHLAAT